MKTMQDWLKEYYPITAEEAADKGDIEALEHSIRKWEGLRPKVLEEHNIGAKGNVLMELPSFRELFFVSSRTCALCIKYIEDKNCEGCPLAKARAGVRCDVRLYSETDSPYGAFIDERDPEPMLYWLKKALEEEEEKALKE